MFEEEKKKSNPLKGSYSQNSCSIPDTLFLLCTRHHWVEPSSALKGAGPGKSTCQNSDSLFCCTIPTIFFVAEFRQFFLLQNSDNFFVTEFRQFFCCCRIRVRGWVKDGVMVRD